MAPGEAAEVVTSCTKGLSFFKLQARYPRHSCGQRVGSTSQELPTIGIFADIINYHNVSKLRDTQVCPQTYT